MTNIADSLHIGTANTGIAPQASGGFGFGPIARTYVYDIVPLTLNATAYAASQSPGAAAVTLTAGTGVTAIVTNGVTRYTADVPRAVTITSGGNDSGITFLVRGFDTYGVAMSEAITGGNVAAATGKKAFLSIISITPSAAAAGTVTAGTSDIFGLPVCVVDAVYITHAGWNATLADNAGTFVAAVTTTAGTTTGDVRGTYAQAGAASNGVRRLVVVVALSSLNIGAAQTVAGVVGVPQA